jgi:hypothetical protein
VEDPAMRPVRVFVAVEPALFSELLVRLLAEPGSVDVTADATADGPFDVVVHNVEVPVPPGAGASIDVELRPGGRSGADVAVVSASTGDDVVPVATIDDLAALIGRLGRP